MIRKLHHTAWRCRDSGETRRFYEDLLGLPLVRAHEVADVSAGRPARTLHTFFRLGDGSFLVFFEAPGQPYPMRRAEDVDRQIALETDAGVLPPLRMRAIAAGIDVRGIGDHGFLRSLCLRDPNGYVVELCVHEPDESDAMDPALNEARGVLDRWQRDKATIA